jgi:tRNA threonylcarbamoyladenosine biosynthesis protein TsaE
VEITYHIDDIDLAAEFVIEHLTSKTVLLNGDMGVGKTTLVKALAKALGSTDIVNSPTFSIVNEYELQNDGIFHFDLYRIENEQDALQFGIEDYLSSNHYIFIEWSEKIPTLVPNNVDMIDIILNNNASRTLKLTRFNNLTENRAMEHKKI